MTSVDGEPDAEPREPAAMPAPAPAAPQRPVQGGRRRAGPQAGRPGAGRPQPNPAVADPTVAEGKAAFERGDLTLAELRAMQALQLVPDHLEALILLYQCRKRTNQTGPKLEAVLRAIVRKNANLFWATSELAFMLFGRGERVECEVHARNAIRLAPRDPQAHGIMELMLTETNRA